MYSGLPLTNFPDKLDDFIIWLNITAQDGPLVKQYQEALQAGDFAVANATLAKMDSGNQKIVKATDLNKLTQAILAMERFYSSDIWPILAEFQDIWVKDYNQISYIGPWSPTASYRKNNIVSYDVQNVTLLYIALKTTVSSTPVSDTRFWRVLTIQGVKGDSGVGLSYRREWSGGTTYSDTDTVSYNGVLWQSSAKNNTNHEPVYGSAYWVSLIDLQNTSYPVQSTPPTAQPDGALWFNTQTNPQPSFVESVNGMTGNVVIPTLISGVIVMWSGSSSDIPVGWALCDGSQGTPDLRGKFILGAGGKYTAGQTGGEEKHTLSVSELPAHTHTGTFSGTTTVAGEHFHNVKYGDYYAGEGHIASGKGAANLYTEATNTTGSHSHNVSGAVTLNNTGSGNAHNNMPPYYALCYIMKL